MKNKSILIIILILILIILIILNQIHNKKENFSQNLDVYYFDFNSDKNVLILGGVHGNEPAGSKVAFQLINDINDGYESKYNLIIIPEVNKSGLLFNMRNNISNFKLVDLNRQYPDKKGIHYSDNYIANNIIKLINECYFSIDLHEGWGYHLQNPKSIGSTIYFTISDDEKKLNYIIDKINKTINENYKKFSLLYPGDDVPKSLSYYCYINNLRHFLIEISGQNNLQPMNIRINQGIFLVKKILSLYF